jgi:hypothetical protein
LTTHAEDRDRRDSQGGRQQDQNACAIHLDDERASQAPSLARSTWIELARDCRS